jgi:hypothetical protein
MHDTDINIEITPTISSPWTEMSSLTVGSTTSTLAIPECFVTVSIDGQPTMRLDLYAHPDDYHCFKEAIVWSIFIAIGFGHRLYLVNRFNFNVIQVDLGEYFGNFYPTDTHLLVASSDRLFCIRPDGSLRWESCLLGLDGVIVHSTTATTIEGDGEWDPPGGWRPFRVSMQDGQLIEDDISCLEREFDEAAQRMVVPPELEWPWKLFLRAVDAGSDFSR